MSLWLLAFPYPVTALIIGILLVASGSFLIISFHRDLVLDAIFLVGFIGGGLFVVYKSFEWKKKAGSFLARDQKTVEDSYKGTIFNPKGNMKEFKIRIIGVIIIALMIIIGFIIFGFPRF